MTTPATKTYYSVTETATFLRAALKQSFPGVKFAVKSKSYSGGASINVYWTDGPTVAMVEAVTTLYQGATFDGQQDLKEYVSQVVMTDAGPREVHYGADFIFEHRHLSAAFLTRIYTFLCRKYGLTPRADAVSINPYSGAELTHTASQDRLFPDGSSSDWCRDTVQDAVYRQGRSMVLVNGLLMALKGGRA